MQAGSLLHLCTKFETDSSIRSKVIRGVKNFEIESRDSGHAHLGVVLYSLCRRGPSSISTEFEVDCSVRSKVIKGVPKLGHVTPATPT